jgi:hypothetical protein
MRWRWPRLGRFWLVAVGWNATVVGLFVIWRDWVLRAADEFARCAWGYQQNLGALPNPYSGCRDHVSNPPEVVHYLFESMGWIGLVLLLIALGLSVTRAVKRCTTMVSTRSRSAVAGQG